MEINLKNLRIQCIPELLFHLNSLSVTLPKNESDSPGSLRIDPREGRSGENKYLISLHFEGISIGALHLPATEQDVAGVRSAYEKNIDSLYRFNKGRARMIQEKSEARRKQDLHNYKARESAREHATSVLREHGFNRITTPESRYLYDTHYQGRLADLGVKELSEIDKSYDWRIHEMTKKAQPGLYAQGVDGDFRKYFKKVVEVRRENAIAKGYISNNDFTP